MRMVFCVRAIRRCDTIGISGAVFTCFAAHCGHVSILYTYIDSICAVETQQKTFEMHEN